jgi:ribosomal protein S18 acetylase RimI-like enzyme
VAELRRATPADADALADVVAEGFVSYLDFAPDGWTAPDRLGLAMGFAVQLHAPDLVCWVAAEPDGTIIGQVAVRPASQHRIKADDPDLAHLGHLFVRRARWGTGLATRLLGTAIDDAEGRGFTAIRLFTPADHARARRFYEREGFTVRGERFHEAPVGLDLIEYRRPVP